MERLDRFCKLHGRQFNRSGAKYRGSHDAVARGDLSRKITVDVKGEILELKNTINTMVDQLNALPEKLLAWRAKSAPRASWAVRRKSRASRHLEGSHGQRQLHG